MEQSANRAAAASKCVKMSQSESVVGGYCVCYHSEAKSLYGP